MDMLVEALERLFHERAGPEVIRAIEQSGDGDALWQEISASGFLDLLLPEEAGGAGLCISDAFAAFVLAGHHALPVPYVQTVMARGWLYAHGVTPPQGPIAIAGSESSSREDGGMIAREVAFGKVADWVLAGFDQQWLLLPVEHAKIEADETRGSQTADFHWRSVPETALNIGAPARSSETHSKRVVCSPTELAAASLAPLLAGAAQRALDMTLAYVAERQQFGRPIAQFQAVQNQISVMAEQVWAMRMAARLALHARGITPEASQVAIGKARCSEAAVQVADTAHALHGAIGITEEYDLQLVTRRLREWRRAGGTEAFWARRLGEQVIRQSGGSALDFILSCTCRAK